MNVEEQFKVLRHMVPFGLFHNQQSLGTELGLPQSSVC